MLMEKFESTHKNLPSLVMNSCVRKEKSFSTLTPAGVFPGLAVVVLPKTLPPLEGFAVVVLPKPNFNFLSEGFNIWKEHISVSSTDIIAPALSNSPQ